MEKLIYSSNLSDIINFLEKNYNETIENFPYIPYEENVVYYGINFKAIIYRLHLGTYEVTHYKINNKRK